VGTVAKLLDRLSGVKPTAPGQWVACCPAHEDRSPSLSIRELEDGRILLHDFAGCKIGDVLAAIGLEMQDLFPERLPGKGPARSYPRSHSKIPARDLLEIISEETAVVSMVAAAIIDSHAVTAEDWARLATAARRIHAARDHLHE
jgi:hypothetical protein